MQFTTSGVRGLKGVLYQPTSMVAGREDFCFKKSHHQIKRIMAKQLFLIMPNQEQDSSNNCRNQTNVILILKNGKTRRNWAKEEEDMISRNHGEF